jgi:hypothetical protein
VHFSLNQSVLPVSLLLLWHSQRVTFANITLQSSILSSDMVGRAQIRWKDILRFEHVKVRTLPLLCQISGSSDANAKPSVQLKR